MSKDDETGKLERAVHTPAIIFCERTARMIAGEFLLGEKNNGDKPEKRALAPLRLATDTNLVLRLTARTR